MQQLPEIDESERVKDNGTVRVFSSGAIRSSASNKLELSKYLSPHVLKRYGEFMHEHGVLPNGESRPGDNWKKGFDRGVWLDSLVRHTNEVWLQHEEGNRSDKEMQDLLCAVIFNAMGYLHQILRHGEDDDDHF